MTSAGGHTYQASLTLGKDVTSIQCHMGHGFPHSSGSMCNRQRQTMSDSVNSESEYSGGQWFLNHFCDWNISCSSPQSNNILVTQRRPDSFQWGLCQFKTSVYIVCFFGRWQLIWKTGDSCIAMIRFLWDRVPHTITPNREPSFLIYQMWKRVEAAGQDLVT